MLWAVHCDLRARAVIALCMAHKRWKWMAFTAYRVQNMAAAAAATATMTLSYMVYWFNSDGSETMCGVKCTWYTTSSTFLLYARNSIKLNIFQLEI